MLSPQPKCTSCQGSGLAKPGARSRVCRCVKSCNQCDSVEKTATGACAVCKKAYKEKADKDWARALVSGAQSRSREKGLEPVTIDHRWVRATLQRQGGLCFYLRTRLQIPTPESRTPQGNAWQPSLDRISNDRGYTIENTQITSWLWNRMRNTMPIEEAISCIELIRANAPTGTRRDLRKAVVSDQTAFVELFLGAA